MDSISFFWSFVKMLASLAVVIGLMIGAAVVMKKYFYQAPSIAQGTGVINILSSRPLGPKHSLVLIEVLGKLILVSFSGQQMTTLATLEDPGALERLKNLQLKEGLAPPPDPLASIKSLFRNAPQTRKDR
jgi:flagellar biosynthetic protein FliO